MSVDGWGALAFGAVIGWFVYYINRYRKGDVQISDVTTLIGAIGGAAVLALFRPAGGGGGDLFGAYGVGLAIGFFAYYLVLLILVAKSPNFDSDWFLDGRRADPGPNMGYGQGQGGIPMMPQASASAPTQIFNIGGAQAVPEAPQAAFAAAGPAEDDPGMPAADEVSETSDFESARILANLGRGAVEEQAPPAVGAAAVPAPLGIDVNRVGKFLNDCTSSNPRVRYGLGAKVPFHGATPGVHFTKIDCSGFVREAIRLSTNPKLPFPDGSVVQHDWVRNKGFQPVAVSNGALNDNRFRIAFLRPQDSPNNIGHVVLIYNARTFESHGGVGPNSRDWTGTGWQRKAYVYEIG